VVEGSIKVFRNSIVVPKEGKTPREPNQEGGGENVLVDKKENYGKRRVGRGKIFLGMGK